MKKTIAAAIENDIIDKDISFISEDEASLIPRKFSSNMYR